jgi:hypothetical protein
MLNREPVTEDSGQDAGAAKRGHAPPAWGTWLVLAASLAFILVSRQGTWTLPQLEWDEATRLSIASSLNHGRTLYLNAWDHHTFLDILFFQQLFRMLPNAWVLPVLRVFNASIVCGLCLLVYHAVRKLGGATAWALGAAVAAGYILAQRWAISGHGEFYHSLPVALAFYLCFGGERTPRRLLAAGALLGVGFFIKQTAIFDLGACLALMLLANRRALCEGTEWRLRTSLRQAGLLAAGIALVAALCAAYFLAHGTLRAALYTTFMDPLVYSTGRNTGETLSKCWRALLGLAGAAGGLSALLTAGAAASWFCVVLMRPRRPPGLLSWRLAAGAAIWLAVDVLGLALIGRFYAHYLVQLTVPAAILCTALLGFLPRRWSWPALSPFVLVLWLMPAIHWGLNGRRKPSDVNWKDVRPVVEYIRARTLPGDNIYLYQDSALCIYHLSQRFPPTKVFMDHQLLPENKDGPALLAQAMASLHASPPKLIVKGALNRSVPEIEAFIRDRYTVKTNFGVHVIFVPKAANSTHQPPPCPQ